MEESQVDKVRNEVQGFSIKLSSSLGEIAKAYMEMDIEEVLFSKLTLAKLETRLKTSNSKDKSEAQSSLGHSNGFHGSGQMQSFNEYNIYIDISIHPPSRLEYNNSLKNLLLGCSYLVDGYKF